jgi:hypothetical protein
VSVCLSLSPSTIVKTSLNANNHNSRHSTCLTWVFRIRA